MSKSLNYLLPALGGTALVLGVTFALMARDYGAGQVAVLEDHVEQAEAQIASSSALVAALNLQLSDLSASKSGSDITRAAPAIDGKLGLGRTAHVAELAAWDVDILPDGRGLPPGKGDVWTGEEVFAEKCASCHGDFAEGVGNWPVLAGGFDTLADKDPVKTVGSYWPELSTLWDYIHRSMPFGGAQTLSDDEVYAMVAYILYSNDIVDEDFELSQDNFNTIEMYNKDGFVIDDRPATEYVQWAVEPCMTDCKDKVEITSRASLLDVTPKDAEISVPVATIPTFDAELVADGKKIFRKCAACHAVGDNARNKSGPQLNGIVGRVMGAADGFKYSAAITELNAEGRVWDADALAAFLKKPRAYLKGTKMAFSGLRSDEDIAAITEYLRSVGN